MRQVSIIVPVYKVESYLSRCVESILAQTYTNFELILVDDGSPDNCGAICDEYAKKDERIHVIHQKNGGLSAARNSGLDIASGEYIYFVDSDDYIEPNLLETVIPYMNNGDDMVAFSYCRFDDNGQVKHKKKKGDQKWFISDNNRVAFLIESLLQNKFGWEAWSRVFRRTIIEKNTLRFADNKRIFAEDLYFCLCYCGFAGRIRYIDKPLYHYYVRSSSIMGTEESKLNASRMNELGKAVKEYYVSHNIESDVIDAFPTIHYFIMDNVFKRYLRNHSISVVDFREVIRADIKDYGFFSKQMKLLRKNKKRLRFIYSRYQAEENVDIMEYYADGNLTLLKIKCRLNDIISKFERVLGD